MTNATETDGRVAIEADDYMGETPVWSALDQALYWINCENAPRLSRWVPATGERTTWAMPERIGGFALRRNGPAVVCLGSGIYDFDLGNGELSLLAASPFPPHVHLHETAVDPSGRLWMGAVDGRFGPNNPWPGGAALCRLEDHTLIPMVPGLSVANCLAFGPDGKTMYFADTMRRVIWRAELDLASGAIQGMREFIRLDAPDIGDGAAVDTEGGYWLAMYGCGEIRRYRSNGVLDRTIKLPFSQPTKPAFGGPGLTTLYITSTQIDVPGFVRSGPNGVVYEVDAGVKGLPEAFLAT